jgi:hypothetical protein
VQLANSDEVPVRLILGVDAEKRVQRAEEARATEAQKWGISPRLQCLKMRSQFLNC